MKFLDWYYSPLAEFDLRLPYSEQNLRELLERECVSVYWNILSWREFKAQCRAFMAQWCLTGFAVFLIKKKRNDILLYPVGKGTYRRCDVHLKIQTDADSTETVLHVAIKKQDMPWSFAFVVLLWLLLFVFVWLAGNIIVAIAVTLAMIPYSFFVMKFVRSKLEKDVPLIRESLERLLEKGNKAT